MKLIYDQIISYITIGTLYIRLWKLLLKEPLHNSQTHHPANKMGFGFNLLIVFVLFPLTVVLLFVWLVTRRKAVGVVIGLIVIGTFAFAISSLIIQRLLAKKILTKDDYYGQYVIDRRYFRGRQADWQYNSFRFEIKENDSIFFYVTDREKILKTYKGTVSTVKSYQSERLMLQMAAPTHHILATNPTSYRSAWSFYLVLNSPRFGNMFFIKGQWKEPSD